MARSIAAAREMEGARIAAQDLMALYMAAVVVWALHGPAEDGARSGVDLQREDVGV